MKKTLLLTFSALMMAACASAQFSNYDSTETASGDAPGNFVLHSDNNVLQVGGRVSAYYENRMLKAGQVNKKHNTFAAKDIDLDILGKTSGHFKYEIQLSLLDLVTTAATANTPSSPTVQGGSNINPNPENTGFKCAYVAYEGRKLPFHIKLGYDKLPYSQGSLNDVYGTPFWSHANLFGGDFFSRRDLGVTLYNRYWHKRIGVYAGAYSGLGENIFEYTGDASGKPEYVGRVDYSYPARIKFNLIDEEVSPKPAFRVGVNARYADKTQPTGRSIYADAPDAPGVYGIRVIDGKKLAYGADMIVKYKGISATFEAHIINLKPTSNTDALYSGTPVSFNESRVRAGGFATGVNYNWQKIHSVFSVSYEDVNANDLLKGDGKWMYFGYAYKVNGFNSVFKVQYYLPQEEDVASNPLKYTGQVRVGYQLVF